MLNTIIFINNIKDKKFYQTLDICNLTDMDCTMTLKQIKNQILESNPELVSSSL